MLKLSIVSTVLAASTMNASAFVPTTNGYAQNVQSTQLEAKNGDAVENVGKMFAAAALSTVMLMGPGPAFADGQTKTFKLPPIDQSDKNRCQFSDSKMGQANVERDKLYNLRQCSLTNKDTTGFNLSGVIMDKTDVSRTKFVEAQFSKGYLRNSIFDGADFSKWIIDRASFGGSSLKGAIFNNAVLTGTSFEDADVENADFTDAYIGDFDIRNLCKNLSLKGENPTTGADTKLLVGCGYRR